MDVRFEHPEKALKSMDETEPSFTDDRFEQLANADDGIELAPDGTEKLDSDEHPENTDDGKLDEL